MRERGVYTDIERERHKERELVEMYRETGQAVCWVRERESERERERERARERERERVGGRDVQRDRSGSVLGEEVE